MRRLAVLCTLAAAAAAAILATEHVPVPVRAVAVVPVLLVLPGHWLLELSERYLDPWLRLVLATATSAGLAMASALVLNALADRVTGSTLVRVAAAECAVLACASLRGSPRPTHLARSRLAPAAGALGTVLLCGALIGVAAGVVRRAAVHAQQRIRFVELWARRTPDVFNGTLRVGVRQRGDASATYRLILTASRPPLLTSPVFTLRANQTLFYTMSLPARLNRQTVVIKLVDGGSFAAVPVRQVMVGPSAGH